MSYDILTVSAPAKVNLALDVIRRREDGYHDLRMIMQSVSLYDRLTLRLAGDGEFVVSSNLPRLPRGQKNIAVRAAKLFFERAGITGWGCHIDIRKNIPVCAGMGGGSADAAAVLLALQERFGNPLTSGELMDLASATGSDVPFCVTGGTALAEGRGELLTPLEPLPHCFFVLCTPPVGISTGAAFKELRPARIKHRPDWSGLERAICEGNLPDIARRCFNVFEEIISEGHREIADIRAVMLDGGALGVSMTGTGPTVLGIFDDYAAALKTRDALDAGYRQTFVAEPLLKTGFADENGF